MDFYANYHLKDFGKNLSQDCFIKQIICVDTDKRLF